MKKLFLIYHYFIYRLKATNTHGVHSPFVFDLLNDVIYNKTNYYSYNIIENLRVKLLQSTQTVNCVDLGAGSLNKNKKNEVKKIAKNALKPTKYAQLLFRLANRFQPETVLELGTSLGLSTAYLASVNSTSKIITIEGCDDIAKIAQENFNQLELKNIEQIIGNINEVLPSALNKTNTLDFVFFDGNHRKQATINYFKQCLLKANENSVFVIDDIYWSPEMKEAWEEIKNHNSVTVTIDLFFLGIVFFKKEQVKQHFTIAF